MSLYQLPDIKFPRIKTPSNSKGRYFFVVIVVLAFIGGFGGMIAGYYFLGENDLDQNSQTSLLK